MPFEQLFTLFIRTRDFDHFTTQFKAWLEAYKNDKAYIIKQLNMTYHIRVVGCVQSVEMTPLEFASLVNHVRLTLLLINSGANLNLRRPRALTPLEHAVIELNPLIVDVLCKNHVAVDMRVLRMAIDSGNTQIIKHLLKKITDDNHRAVKNGTKDFINLANAGLFYALHNKVTSKIQTIFINYVLQQPDLTYDWLLEISIEYACLPLLHELLNRKVDLHFIRKVVTETGKEVGLTMLEVAWKHEKWQIADMLLDNGFDPNFRLADMRMIHRAAPFHLAVDALVKHGADVNYVTGDAASPVLFAVVGGSVEYLKKLLEHGATPNGHEYDGDYPSAAIQRSNKFYPVAKLLLQHKDFDHAQLFSEVKSETFPLYYLLRYGGLGVLKIVLSLPLNAELKGSVMTYGLVVGLSMGLNTYATEIIKLYVSLHGTEVTLNTIKEIKTLIELDDGKQDEKLTLIRGLEAICVKLSSDIDDQKKLNGISANFHEPIAAPARILSGRSYLKMTHGWKDADFEEREDEPEEDALQRMKPTTKKATWFNGRLDEGAFRSIENASSNKKYFIYIPGMPQDHDLDRAGNLDLFRNKSRFTFGKSVKNVVSASLKASLRIFDTVYQAKELTHELKLKSTADRLLCAEFPSDDGEAVLFVAVRFAKDGLHTHGQVCNLQNMSEDIIIDIDFSRSLDNETLRSNVQAQI